MMTPIPAVVPPLQREQTWKRNIAPATALDWLAAGWRDFTIYPAASISYGILVFLVSVITVVELTKQTAIYATNVGSWIVPGALCAAVYLAMSLPLSRLARRLERRWRVP